MSRSPLQQLVMMSRALGDPARDYVRLGEGNTSAARDARTFWVKASGVPLAGIQARDFVVMEHAAMQNWLDRRSGPPVVQGRPPSIEALFHAILLKVPGVQFVGHTHPTAATRLLCARDSRRLFRAPLFPDEIVYCGPAPVYVPYHDPGIPLARAIQRGVAAHRRRYGEAPRLILLENHGLIALGDTPRTVLAVTAMAVKAAEVRWGTLAAGGPRTLSRHQARAIARRPDEQYRRRLLSR